MQAKNKIITKANIVKNIYKKLGSAIPYRTIHHSVNIIVDQIIKEIIEDRVISARHFGTISPFLRAGCNASDLITKKVWRIPPMRSVKFYPHESFRLLLKERKDRFQKINSTKKLRQRKVLD